MKAASQRGLLLQEEIEDIVSHNESDEESEDSEEDSEEESNEDDMEPWISWFCSFRGHEFFCEIDEDYIRDNFNLTGLSSMVGSQWHVVVIPVVCSNFAVSLGPAL